MAHMARSFRARHCCRCTAVAFGVLGVLASGAWEKHNGKLAAMLDVLDMLPNGTIPIPDGTRRIFLEVGANSINIMAYEELPLFPDGFVISFEPLLHQYAALLGHRTRPDEMRRLGEASERNLVLPFAIAPDGDSDSAELRIAGSADTCASLLREHSARDRPECANPDRVASIRRAPTFAS
uniref:Uncharacterized protein n=1 Tax=Alexandrium monilatum TaxID=311494 RepID=A0A7S4RZ71_9DINO